MHSLHCATVTTIYLLDTFDLVNSNSVLIKQWTPIIPHPHTLETAVLLSVCDFDSYEWNHIVFVFLWLIYISSDQVLKIHPCWIHPLKNVFLFNWIIIHWCVYAYQLINRWTSLIAQLVKNPPAVWETWVWSLGWEDPLENGKATHSSILAWRIPWTA